MKAPFPYFGGKSRIAHVVWEHFGDVDNYVEPFFGSGAVLLARPGEPGIETVNDKDAFLANFWRAIKSDPGVVAKHADWPVNEVDLYARHKWLVNSGAPIVERLRDDPDFFDSKIAGWWVWGISQWIGGGWCVNGNAQIPHLGDAGMGIHRKLPHLGDAGKGIHRRRPHLLHHGTGTATKDGSELLEWFVSLADRLRSVRVCCGDWHRVTGESVTIYNGLTGVFLDPPYSHAERDDGCYSTETDCSSDVRAWAIANGDNPMLRIALCGYDTEHAEHMPDSWTAYRWKAHGGYGNRSAGRGRSNAKREVIWFSPHCINNSLFKHELFG